MECHANPNRCQACGCEPAHLVTVWRDVHFIKPVCPNCANKTVTNMIKKKEIPDPFLSDDLANGIVL